MSKENNTAKAVTQDRGISALKDLIKFVIIATQKALTADANGNGKISLPEAFSVMTTIGFKIPGLTRVLPDVIPEWKDLTREERDELVKWFAEEFDLPGLEKGKIEALIEEAVAIILDTDAHIKRIRAILG